MTRNKELSMSKRIPIWMGLLVLLSAMAAQATAQEQEQEQEQVQGEQSQQQQGGDGDEDGDEGGEGREGPPIYPNLAVTLIEMGVPVVDVRSDEEVEETGTLADAAHIPHTEIDEIMALIGENTSRAVILYCGSGRRAGRAIENLRERGYHGMVNAGGFEDLREALEGEAEEEG